MGLIQNIITKINFRKILKYSFYMGLAVFLFASSYTTYYYFKWVSSEEVVLEKLKTYKKQLDYLRTGRSNSENQAGSATIGAVAIPTVVYDRNGFKIGEFFIERRTLIPIEQVPPYVIKALIASEDRNFYDHGGVSYRSIGRAMIRNLVTMRFSQGGSTITQQLAKVLFTQQEKTIGRKIFEYFCTLEIEDRFTKDEILEMYLNLIYMGHGNYGVESASQYYFNKNARRLTIGEASMLIGLLPNPTLYSPVNNLSQSIRRQKTVFTALSVMNLLTDKQIKYETKRFNRRWDVQTKDKNLVSSIGDFPDRAYRLNRAPFFLDYINSLLLTQFSPEVITKGGLKVYTTLDYSKQKIATEALSKQVKKQKEYYNKLIKKASAKNRAKYQSARDKTNGVFISIEPSSGHVLTMIGGAKYSTANQFNRALKAYRQVGSLMKPFVYYLALLNEYVTPATIVSDSPYSKGGFDFNNYDYKYLGDITVYEALKKSRNTVAVRLMEQVGHKKLRDLMSDLLNIEYGAMKKRIPAEIGVALGTVEFTPLEMATAYGAFINNGQSVTPKFILKVQQDNKILYEPASEASRQVVDPSTSFILINMMQGVFTENGTAGWVSNYRNKNPDKIPYQIAGKTGTTSGYKDAWFVGLTSDEVSIVWVGSDYNASLGSGRSGGSLCSPAWVNYIVRSKQNSHPKNFSEIYTLENITYETFCPLSGGVPHDESLCLERIDHPFLASTEPDYFCPLHDPVPPPPPAFDEDENNVIEDAPGADSSPIDEVKTEVETPVEIPPESDGVPKKDDSKIQSKKDVEKST